MKKKFVECGSYWRCENMENINKLLQSDNFSVHLFAETVNNLKNSQGYYSRLYENINILDEYDLENFVTELTMQNFNDTLDVIMWLEG